MLTEDRRVVPFTLLAQLGVSLGLAVLLGLWLGKIVALSALLGGMVAVVPNAFLAASLMLPRAGAHGGAVVRSAWFGEIGKLLLTILMFGAVFAFVRPVSAPALLGTFIAAQMVVFGALLLGSGSVGKSTT